MVERADGILCCLGVWVMLGVVEWYEGVGVGVGVGYVSVLGGEEPTGSGFKSCLTRAGFPFVGFRGF